jgi:RND superfamily putative drug exporter
MCFRLVPAFGAMVWIFQDGHLRGLGTTATGILVANIPVLLFCIAFGLSMDYEVFLVSRIREFWLQTARTRADNDESVALGIARTGRVVTAAAVVMSISFAALIGRPGVVHADVRPWLDSGDPGRRHLGPHGAASRIHACHGEWNWWAPKWMTKLHDRFGIEDGLVAKQPTASASTIRP